MKQIKCLEQIPSVDFAFGGDANKGRTSLGRKNKTNLSDKWQKLKEWPNQQFGTFLKSNSAKPKGLEDKTKVDDHRILSLVKKNTSQDLVMLRALLRR